MSPAGDVAPFDERKGVWLRCQLHAHTTESDGWLSPPMLRRYHAAAGYDVLAITDHDRLTPDPEPHHEDDGLILLGGTELSLRAPRSGGPMHLLGLGTRELPMVDTRTPLIEAAAAVRAAGGLAFLAHPWWSGHWTHDVEDFTGVAGIEVFNAGCEVEQGRGASESHWDAWLAAGHRLTAIATDDLHTPGFESFRAWTMVHATERTREAVLAALAEGRFYSTTGPRITRLSLENGGLLIKSTPAQSIATVAQPPYGGRVNAGHHELAQLGHRLPTADGHTVEGLFDGDLLTGAFFPIPPDATRIRYLRVVVTDTAGCSAWSNPIWLS